MKTPIAPLSQSANCTELVGLSTQSSAGCTPIPQKLLPPFQRNTCTLPIELRLALLADGQAPCAGCHQDRSVCGGEPRTEGGV